MKQDIIQVTKVIFLALVLTLGVNYVMAWTGPTQAPPSGNTPTPVNVGVTDQVKSGGLGLDTLSVFGESSLDGVIFGNGSNSAYGAFTMQGSKGNWSGVNFKNVSGANSGTLMMHPSYSGFYNAADNGWRWYVDNTGTTRQSGIAVVNGGVRSPSYCDINGANCITSGGGEINYIPGVSYGGIITYTWSDGQAGSYSNCSSWGKGNCSSSCEPGFFAFKTGSDRDGKISRGGNVYVTYDCFVDGTPTEVNYGGPTSY